MTCRPSVGGTGVTQNFKFEMQSARVHTLLQKKHVTDNLNDFSVMRMKKEICTTAQATAASK
ncbi:hypothetical protein Cst04h_16070 [Corynebacterium striatum]|uniref:Uncharacterized protein n=1 Tax=Corynebacterium striatum TaxID=43770 RepID=A0ABC9ZMQ0_CORST|nr:hypothetical protein Cst04h_16070 [Corynebacterium striatum]